MARDIVQYEFAEQHVSIPLLFEGVSGRTGLFFGENEITFLVLESGEIEFHMPRICCPHSRTIKLMA